MSLSGSNYVHAPCIGVVQMVSSQTVDVNLQRAEVLIAQAVSDGANAVFLPENFAALANPNTRTIAAKESSNQGPIRGFLSEISARHGCWIFAGTLPLSLRPDQSRLNDGRVRAASMVYNACGIEVARYDKIHMFDVEVQDNQVRYAESDIFEPGGHLVVIDSPIGKVGLSVCYDIRFADIYRALFLKGAECLAIPSAFTTVTGEAHFEVLMRARAIENFSYTIAACQGGQHDSGRMTYGHSMVVGPWGEVIAKAGQGESVIACRLDFESLYEMRRKIPIGDGFKTLVQ